MKYNTRVLSDLLIKIDILNTIIILITQILASRRSTIPPTTISTNKRCWREFSSNPKRFCHSIGFNTTSFVWTYVNAHSFIPNFTSTYLPDSFIPHTSSPHFPYSFFPHTSTSYLPKPSTSLLPNTSPTYIPSPLLPYSSAHVWSYYNCISNIWRLLW